MTVGTQTDKTTIDGLMSNLAVAIRNLAQKGDNLITPLASGNDIHGMLVAIGYDDTAQSPSPMNPDGLSDAALAARYIGYMKTLIGIYEGTVYQGGDGTANSLPTLFNYDNALSPLWAGQI